MGNIQVGAGHFWLTYFQASVGLFFWKIPDEQFNLGHWSLSYSLLNQQYAKAWFYEIKTFFGGGLGGGKFT